MLDLPESGRPLLAQVEKHFREKTLPSELTEAEGRRVGRAQMRSIARNVFVDTKSIWYEKCVMRLHLAIVVQAIRDRRAEPGDEWLKEWLLVDGLFILQVYDQPVDSLLWKKFILEGCPGDFNLDRR